MDVLDRESVRNGGPPAQRGVASRGHVEESTTAAAVGMMVAIQPRLVARRLAVVTDAHGQARLDQGIEHLVDGLLAELGEASPQAPVQLSRRPVLAALAQERQHGHALAGGAQSAARQLVRGLGRGVAVRHAPRVALPAGIPRGPYASASEGTP